MAKADFIPELWSAAWLRAYEDEVIYARGTDRAYESELRQGGDRVKIPQSTLVPTVSDYAVDTDIADPEVQDGSNLELEMDKQKYWHIYVDSIDRFQSRPDLMLEAVRVGAREMAFQIDDDVQATFKTSVTAGTTIVDTSKASAVIDGHLNKMIDLRMAMDRANVPSTGRFMVVNPLFMARLEKHLLANSNTQFFPATNDQALRNGYQGRLLGFDLRMSNRIVADSGLAAPGDATTVWPLYAGVGQEVAFASQITEMSTYEPEKRFGTAVKALQVYGSKKLRNAWKLTIKGVQV